MKVRKCDRTRTSRARAFRDYERLIFGMDERKLLHQFVIAFFHRLEDEGLAPPPWPLRRKDWVEQAVQSMAEFSDAPVE